MPTPTTDDVYDEDYAIEDGDEVHGLLQGSRRHTPLHINTYLSQMEKLQKQRKARQRQFRLLALSLGVVTLCGIAWTRQSHVELEMLLFKGDAQESTPRAAFSHADAPDDDDSVPSSNCNDATPCVHFLPTPETTLKDTCGVVDASLYESLALYLVEKQYMAQWPLDVNFTCTTPTVSEWTASALPAPARGPCHYHADVVGLKANGTIAGLPHQIAGTFVTRATQPIVASANGTHALLLGAHVSETWRDNMLQGVPGFINPSPHGIWLTVDLPNAALADTTTVVVVEKKLASNHTIQLSTTVNVPSGTTGLLALRLDQSPDQRWLPGDYDVVVADTWHVPFTVLSTDSRANFAVFDEKLDSKSVALTHSATDAKRAQACVEYFTTIETYCSCQKTP
ncbi:Aste57867_1565 [Aphanomyces stellatus]|uniref:Aste57867_1565 protein n=1 Tax=Aphanomyces stellatus TaxID=120398 RepID=A0A485K849_9STRA|nr:hypothetical protein As57867_001564 [Aphanomyces stellatus]VFT78778.1 Aste57867_1565 [Aphanomyces stellatus]